MLFENIRWKLDVWLPNKKILQHPYTKSRQTIVMKRGYWNKFTGPGNRPQTINKKEEKCLGNYFWTVGEKMPGQVRQLFCAISGLYQMFFENMHGSPTDALCLLDALLIRIRNSTKSGTPRLPETNSLPWDNA